MLSARAMGLLLRHLSTKDLRQLATKATHIYHDHTCKNAANAAAHRLKEELKL
jgi:hypothetical protein